MQRLKQWCEDVNAGQNRVHYDFVFVEEDDFKTYKPQTFAALVKAFQKYKA
jgi:type III restriction enzyme